jgi:hypothetical protein
MDQFVTSTIDYDGVLGTVEVQWSIDNPVFGNSIPMTNTNGNTWVSDTAIPEQPVGTKIYFKVVATGDNNDTSETYKFMYTVKPFEYCTSNGSGGSSLFWITNVNIEDLDTNVILDNTSTNSGNTAFYYDYYDAISPTTTLKEGSTYTLKITMSKDRPNIDYGAWIDFNNDRDFDDVNEEIMFFLNEGDNIAEVQFTVPIGAKLNEILRLRVHMSRYDDEVSSCSTTERGEVEDYNILITEKCPLNNTAGYTKRSSSQFCRHYVGASPKSSPTDKQGTMPKY